MTETPMWMPLSLSLRWGDYFKPGPDDELKTVQTVQQAKSAGLLTDEMALRKVSRIFGIENIAATLDAINEARDAKRKADAEDADAQAKRDAMSLHTLAGGMTNADGSGTGASQVAPPAAGGVGSVVAAAPRKTPKRRGAFGR